MFNPKWEHPLVMGSWQHLVALAVVIFIILSIFFLRKFFMKHKLADIIFRYTLGLGLIIFELILQLHNGARPLFGRVIADTYPMCGYMIWFCAIALMSNSDRLMKLIYPLTIIGGGLSLIVLDMNCTFPHFGAFQFWFVHGGFMLGSLYFLFTKKIEKYTIKDFGHSCLFLFILSCYVLTVSSGKLMLNSKFTDPLFIISPPGGLESVKESLGQLGYTTIYILLIVSLLFLIYGITFLCTKRRKIDASKKIDFKENKVLEALCKVTSKWRYIIIICIFGFGLYATVLYRVTSLKFLLILEEILFLLLILLMIINEIITLYEKSKKNFKM